jgi:hypothetical protein
VYEYERGEVREFARRVAVICLGVAALVMAVVAAPAEAEQRKPPVKSAEQPIADPANGEPMTLVVSLSDQKIDVYRGTKRIASSNVSSGMPGYATEAGVFSIHEKRRYHRSNIYSGAPMPWMQRLTWSGIALHGGVVPGYRASHGCVRVPFSFAPKLFQITTVGEHLVVASDRVVPELIEHPALFQPLPPPGPPIAMVQETSQQSSGVFSTSPRGAELALVRAVNPFSDTLILTTKIEAGTTAAGIEAASPRPTAPLRVLVTRRTKRDRIRGVQYTLSAMGYLEPQDFDGTFGRLTVNAIKAFQKDQGLPETGAFTDDLVKRVYATAGKAEPPEGHLFVRQNFRSVFDVPIAFRNPEEPLGTHVFTAMTFASGETETEWMAISLEGDDAAKVLDRIRIPDGVRQKISERLTPGSSLIIGDRSINSAILPEGGDFLVLANETVLAEETPAVAEKPRAASPEPKHAAAKKKKPQPSAQRYSDSRSKPNRRGLFSRWFSRR